ncbi:hypothetical protein [Streptomyces cellostaticus]|uniref:hypothetical protein n=1 Tax=Streptomyces cellostaticus TaxID=67285 RepID=UPI000ACCBBF4|nr:hypothetical protein [Streptomyces cellostaticus]GHI10312.1 hypothetical protein Scel_86330 [Streptomyces cellostaticus]
MLMQASVGFGMLYRLVLAKAAQDLLRGQGAQTIRVSAQGWPYGQMGVISPLP